MPDKNTRTCRHPFVHEPHSHASQDLFRRCRHPGVEVPYLCQLATGQQLRFGLSEHYTLKAMVTLTPPSGPVPNPASHPVRRRCLPGHCF